MYEVLKKYLKNKIDIGDMDFEVIKSKFKPKNLRKKQYLMQEGDICKYYCFVSKGILRLFSIDAKGNESILQFAPEEWWISDRESIVTQIPSRYNIEALEDSELLLITPESYRELSVTIPAFYEMQENLHQRNIVAQQRRIHAAISYTAEEKYLEFIEAYPDIFQRVPQHMIASYLGMSPETLSRIRSKL
ncbi:MAG: Crp/Fnr family transcriptional regulator [Ignavibacteriales bacterium]|nr:MAG: Crp/Fnr family transcriptional regulator [Ignavibacteriales bacterium]